MTPMYATRCFRTRLATAVPLNCVCAALPCGTAVRSLAFDANLGIPVGRVHRIGGLGYVFCDTDSMAFARPDGETDAAFTARAEAARAAGLPEPQRQGMTRERFRELVAEIAGPTGWFQPLNPYQTPTTIFNHEKANFKLKDQISGKVTDEFEPLYCLAISAKRYVLYNRTAEGIVIRKASAHGLGDVSLPIDYIHGHPRPSPLKDEHIAAPVDLETGNRRYGAVVNGAGARLFLDMWKIAIEQFEAGIPENIDRIIAELPGMNAPQVSQTSLSTSHIWDNYRGLPNRRPFQFFMTLPPPVGLFGEITPNEQEPVRFDERRGLLNSSLYATFTKEFKIKTLGEYQSLGAGLEGLYRRDNSEFPRQIFNNDWGLTFTTIADRVRGYFNKNELKSYGERGQLDRKCVAGLDKVCTGKESNPLADIGDNPDDETLEQFEVGVSILEAEFNINILNAVDLNALAEATGIDVDLLARHTKTGKRLTSEQMVSLRSVLFVGQDGHFYLKAKEKAERPNPRKLIDKHGIVSKDVDALRLEQGATVPEKKRATIEKKYEALVATEFATKQHEARVRAALNRLGNFYRVAEYIQTQKPELITPLDKMDVLWTVNDFASARSLALASWRHLGTKAEITLADIEKAIAELSGKNRRDQRKAKLRAEIIARRPAIEAKQKQWKAELLKQKPWLTAHPRFNRDPKKPCAKNAAVPHRRATGIYFDKLRNVWVVQIQIDTKPMAKLLNLPYVEGATKKRWTVGRYANYETAVEARDLALTLNLGSDVSLNRAPLDWVDHAVMMRGQEGAPQTDVWNVNARQMMKEVRQVQALAPGL